MSKLLKALTQSMQKNTPRTLFGTANLVGEVISYGDKTIKVKFLNGPIAGQEGDINPGNKKVEDFSKPAKAQTSSYTPVGGILRFDGVSAERDGSYKAKWTNAWIKHPGDDHHVLIDQMVSYIDKGQTNKDGKPIISLHVIDIHAEKKVASLDEMRDTLAEAFGSTGAALVIETSEGFFSKEYFMPRTKTEAGYVSQDPAEFAQKLIDEMNDETKALFSTLLADKGMTIVPLRSVYLGATSADETKKLVEKANADGKGKQARIMTVNPYAYEAPSIGVRLAGALARKDRDGNLDIPKEYAERLKDAFLATAAEDAKAAYHKDGWRAVSDIDLKDFFKANGVDLKTHETKTWNLAAVHMQRYEGGDSFFAAKTHEAYRFGSPYPALECCKEVRQAYNVELTEAVRAVVGSPAVANEAKETAAAAPKAEEKAADAAAETPAAAAMSAEDEAGIDDLLAGIADEPLN
ncbi:hypothetical protein [Defluviimonas salinarum]|uniref:Uncharacterized protein n=1 Tax=Defluviimonas salinarum TaxID=2992147 RepID=A0ABT3J5M6_9RHOB|nr:hypothetical protein [Defluviimonas salinarum]MCW3782978.1 hypothetical protein [Defluviimonas salinarum]